jgi:hypothetical protein
MKLKVGVDERALLVDVVLTYLEGKGHEVVWYGPQSRVDLSWP